MNLSSAWPAKPAGLRRLLGMTVASGLAGVAGATTVSFTSPGYVAWTVPAGVTSLNIVATGGGGGVGAGPGGPYVQPLGGPGCIVIVNGMAVSAGDTLSLLVGGAGAPGTASAVG